MDKNTIIATGAIAIAITAATVSFFIQPAPPAPVVSAQPTDQSADLVTSGFDVGMRTGYLFALRGGTPEQLDAALRVAVTNRQGIVLATLNGALFPARPAVAPPSNLQPTTNQPASTNAP